MALNGFLQRLGLQKDLRTHPREGVWGDGGGQACVYMCAVAIVADGERDGADAGSV